MSSSGTPSASPRRSLLRRVDDAVFAVEQGLVALCLATTTVIVFFDVANRRLVAPDSKIASMLQRIVGSAGAAAAVGPWVSGVGGALVVWFAFRTAERRVGKPLLPIPGSAAVLALGASALLGGLGWMLVNIPSRWVYATVYVLAHGGIVLWQWRAKSPGWKPSAVVAVVALPTVGWLLVDYVPEQYGWAKELAMLMILWVGFFGASLCVYVGKHIRIEALEKAVPAKARRYVAAGGHLLTAAFCALLAYLGYEYIFDPQTGLYATAGVLELTRVPDWVQTIAVPFAFGLTTLRFLGAAVSSVTGGTYGQPAKAEGMEDAEKLASGQQGSATREPTTPPASATPSAESAGKPVLLLAVGALIVVLPFLGKGGILLSAILAMTVVGAPVFVLLGIVCILCFVLWGGVTTVTDLTIIERIRSLADNQALLAIPFFVMSGNVMRHGEISKRLAGFAQALFGWLPGGLAVSTVAACIFFAAISGSSPSTVVAIGSMMAPALINKGYKESFSHGLVTSAGSLGILIPPSIPMIVYQIVNTRAHIELERLWFSGYGPALVIGLVLATLGIVHGIRHKIPRQPFSARTLLKEARDGFWSLMFPLLIYLGIRHGFVNAIEAACFAVVYAVTIEVFVHRALELRDLPGIFQETGIMLGSFLVILVAAMTFGEFLDQAGLPQMATQWVRDAHLAPWQFLIAVNLLLLVVGCLLDILSAIFVFVPLLAPMAVAAGINPYHFGIIFIVNMEIGYLTPPVGLNLFIASTLFDKSVGYLTRAVLPFVGVMLIGLTYITFDGGASSIGLSNRLLGAPPTLARRPDGRDVHGGRAGGRPGVGAGGSGEAASGGGDMSGSAGGASLEDMLRQAEEQVAAEHHDAGSPDSGPTSRDAGSPDAGSTSASRVGEP